MTRTAEGTSERWIYSVRDVAGSTEAIRWNATNDPNVPKVGDDHLVIPDAKVTQSRVVDVSGRHVQIEITYETPGLSGSSSTTTATPNGDPGEVEVAFFQEEACTRFDGNGVLMDHSYTAAAETIKSFSAFAPDFTSEARAYVLPVELKKPVTHIGISNVRYESQDDTALWRQIMNGTNDGTWSGRPAKTWRLVGRTSVKDSSTGLWQARYDWFVHNVDGGLVHTSEFKFGNYFQVTGGATYANGGLRDFDVYKPLNFSGLVPFEFSLT